MQDSALPRYSTHPLLHPLRYSRRLFIAVDAETTTADADATTQYHIPHVHVSTGLRGMVLFERCHMFHCQNRRFPPLQLFMRQRLHRAEMRV